MNETRRTAAGLSIAAVLASAGLATAQSNDTRDEQRQQAERERRAAAVLDNNRQQDSKQQDSKSSRELLKKLEGYWVVEQGQAQRGNDSDSQRTNRDSRDMQQQQQQREQDQQRTGRENDPSSSRNSSGSNESRDSGYGVAGDTFVHNRLLFGSDLIEQRFYSVGEGRGQSEDDKSSGLQRLVLIESGESGSYSMVHIDSSSRSPMVLHGRYGPQSKTVEFRANTNGMNGMNDMNNRNNREGMEGMPRGNERDANRDANRESSRDANRDSDRDSDRPGLNQDADRERNPQRTTGADLNRGQSQQSGPTVTLRFIDDDTYEVTMSTGGSALDRSRMNNRGVAPGAGGDNEQNSGMTREGQENRTGDRQRSGGIAGQNTGQNTGQDEQWTFRRANGNDEMRYRRLADQMMSQASASRPGG